ncbi:putative disease resistance protein RGA4 [Hordeum vulgare]|nr:putative disease resistance protein RGA4 [Hordeum vulgare]
MGWWSPGLSPSAPLEPELELEVEASHRVGSATNSLLTNEFSLIPGCRHCTSSIPASGQGMAEAALSATQWVVAKALAPVTDGLLEAWEASRNFGLNIEVIRDTLLLVKATLEIAGRKEIGGPAMEELLQRLGDSAHNAEDLLDELDYFRIHDELHNTYEAADEHGESGVQDLARDARHTAKAIGKRLASLTVYCFAANTGQPRQEDARKHASSCCAWQHGRRRSPGDSSSAPNPNQEVSGCMPKLGKLFLVSSSRHPHVSGDEDRCNAQETPKLDFNRVEFSQKMKDIVEKLQPLCKDVNKILQSCGPRIVPDIAQHRPTTTPQSAEPKLYGRDRVMNNTIHDITEGQYCDKCLTVLPVVGPGGMGKTSLIQHIYHNQQVQNHFPVRIWICVSFNFNLDKVLEQIKRDTLPVVVGENGCSTTQEFIEHRLKCKRFLLVLDDIWQFTDVDDWKKLLLILNKSQEKGSMILVTTRFQEIAKKVRAIGNSIQLNGLEPEEFRKLFLSYVFDDGQCPRNKLHLLDKIMEKLKGSPLAAKTVGRLLRTEPSMDHWRRVLNSEEWETDNNGIMSALKLSYDFLPFHLQQCFSYSALFPEDYRFRGHELISLWVGLDILTPCGQNPTFEGGLRILNDLVIHGFFREEETDGDPRYVMHDLLHELALKVASNDCLSLHLRNIGSVKIQPTTRHLSISIDDLDKYDVVSGEKLKSELEILKTRLKVDHLQTLMLFGEIDEGFVKIFGDFLGEANALRVLHFPSMLCPVESMLQNFSGLVHLRYLSLGTYESEMHLPLNISRFYHLRILDLELWHGSRDLPEDMSNLAKLCHFYAPGDGQLHSDIYNVGKLKLLEELKVFQVNKRSEGFEPKQLEHLSKLTELGICNLEKIHTGEEATQAKLIERSHLRKLTLDWDSERSSVEPSVEAEVLESLQPHGDLQVLCIRGHRGPSCPTWLGDEFSIEALQSLWLDGVSWDVFPSLGKAWDLRKLRLENIAGLKEVIMEKSFCMLIKLELIGLGSFEKWVYPAEQESSVGGDLLRRDAHVLPLLQVLIIRVCPKFLEFPISNHILYPNWLPKLQELEILDCPEFSSVIHISWIESLRHISIRQVKLLKQFTYSKSSDGAELEIVGEGYQHSLGQVLIFDKEIRYPKQSLQRLRIRNSRAFLSSFSRHLFPSSLQSLELTGVEGMRTLEPLSNLSFVTELTVCWCGEDLKCEGLQSLLTTGGHLRELKVLGSPGFFVEWDPNPRRALEDVQGGEEQHTQVVSSTLQKLWTDDAAGLLSAPICSFLSSSLLKLELSGHVTEGMEHFSKEQEEALQLLSSLQELAFLCLPVLQQLPVGLHNLTNLKVLSISECLQVSSLPKDGLPKSLQELHVTHLCSRELIEQCKGLEGTIPTIRTHC